MQDIKAFPSLRRALFAVIFMLIALQVTGAILSQLLQGFSQELLYTADALKELIVVGLPAFLWSSGKGSRGEGAVRRYPLRGGLLLAVTAVLSVPAMQLIAALWYSLLSALGLTSAPQGMAVPQGMASLLICLVSTSVVAPLCEEEFFRGRLFAALETLGTRTALIVSSLLFALIHGQLIALPVHIILGFILGGLLVQKRSIKAATLFHACYNAATVLFASLPFSGQGMLMSAILGSFGLEVFMLWAMCLYALLRPADVRYVLAPMTRMDSMSKWLLVLALTLLLLPYLLSGGLL